MDELFYPRISVALLAGHGPAMLFGGVDPIGDVRVRLRRHRALKKPDWMLIRTQLSRRFAGAHRGRCSCCRFHRGRSQSGNALHDRREQLPWDRDLLAALYGNCS
jgi:hypothetical protein